MLREVWPFVAAERGAGRRVVLARLVARSGPGARPVGAALAVSESGAWAGSVSGGCVDGDVLAVARAVLDGAAPRTVRCSAGGDRMPWEAGPSCRSLLQVLVAPAPEDGTVVAVSEALEGVVPVTVRTSLDPPYAMVLGEDPLPGRTFDEVLDPRPLLVLVGATDVATALAPLADAVGRRVVVVDPRPDFAQPQRVPGSEVRCAWPQQVLPSLGLQERDAVLVLTHDAKIDDPALRAALGTAAGHIGVLGSRATHAERLSRLAGAPGLGRISGPAGLDLGGSTAAEVALSMLAEVVAVAHGRGGERLSATMGPVQAA
ncbi:xanthine dehydrogenase accessory factor [Motilibacter rhizosphaerae]|uniref:Xanthine dehydrogenase accessory factor n=1 Tax=Motilibacter rhizosphaerae TaxID=598652 RepID=A0A4Q7NWS7_9ACTN|nr:XdhC/CoxI family protein [Motilibacter rhizosphaerae]RZS91685.1 xanthine dehydrogenase accessory factor [Motilibacter rhizosphaerae]